MKTVYHIIVFTFLMAPCIGAQERGVEISARGEDLLKTVPRRIVTAGFQVTNETSERQELLVHVKLPQGWMLVVESPSFCLGPNESDTRLVSFLIPQTALAGRYELTYLVKAKEHPLITDSSTIDVVVLPVRKLEVKLLEAPDFTIAGEDYQASFAIINGSNTESKVSIKIDSGENLPFAVNAEELELTPGESRTLAVVVGTDVNRKEPLRHHLRLTAQSSEDQETKAQVTSHVEILPRITGTLERFHKIPTDFIFSYVTMNDEQRASGFQATVSGSGHMHADGQTDVSFFLRGPAVQDKFIFGQRDEYRFSLWTEKYALRLGDQVFSVSPLVVHQYFGRGFEGRLELGKFKVGAYGMRTRWHEPEERHIAGYADYMPLDKFQMGINYLNKEIDGEKKDVASLECRWDPFENTDLDFEYATGQQNRKKGDAYRLETSVHWSWITYISRFAHAQPGAPVSNADRDLASAVLLLRPMKNLKLQVSLEQAKNNLEMDPALVSASLEKLYKAGFDYKFLTGTNFYAYWRDRGREDRLPDPEFHYREETVLLGVAQSFHKLGFNISAEPGRRHDKLSQQVSDVVRYKIYAHSKPTGKLSFSGYLQGDKGGDCSQEKRRRITAGLNSSLRAAERTLFSVNFQTCDHIGSYREGRSTLEMSLSHRFRNQSQIEIRGRRMSFGNITGKYESALKMEISIPFGLPTARKKTFGGVQGCVYDRESSQPLADVILKIDDATAVSDKNGNFSFPALKPGAHYLSVFTAGIGLERIPVQKNPLAVMVTGGEQTRVEVGMARAASLTGQVMRYRPEEKDDSHCSRDRRGNPQVVGQGSENGCFIAGESTLVEDQGIAGVLIELSNGVEALRCFTDDEGRFKFEEIRPQDWTLKIYEENLPEYHYLDMDAYNFELKPGEKEHVLIKVLPQRRRIQIIAEGEILRGAAR